LVRRRGTDRPCRRHRPSAEADPGSHLTARRLYRRDCSRQEAVGPRIIKATRWKAPPPRLPARLRRLSHSGHRLTGGRGASRATGSLRTRTCGLPVREDWRVSGPVGMVRAAITASLR
jgi:hypothetical protein